MNNRKLTYWLAIAILILIGVALAFWASMINHQDSFGKSMLNRASTAALVTSLLGVLNRILLEENLLSLILEKVNLKRDINDTGLKSVYTDISDIDYQKLFAKTNAIINIVHVYGRTWTSNNEDSIVDALARGIKITVILCDRDCPTVPAMAMMYDWTEEKVKERIDGVIEEWRGILRKVDPEKKDNLIIRVGLMVPSYSLYRFDQEMVIVSNRLSNGNRTKKVNSYTCVDIEDKTTLFANNERDFQDLLRNSVCVIPEPQIAVE